MKKLILLLVAALVVTPAYPQPHVYVFGALSDFSTDHSHRPQEDYDTHLVGSGSGYQIGFGFQANGYLGLELIYDRAPRFTYEEFSRVFGTTWYRGEAKKGDFLTLVLTGSYRPPCLNDLRLVAKGGYSHYWQRYLLTVPTFTGFLERKKSWSDELLRLSAGVQLPIRKTGIEIDVFLNRTAMSNVQTFWVSSGLRYRF